MVERDAVEERVAVTNLGGSAGARDPPDDPNVVGADVRQQPRDALGVP